MRALGDALGFGTLSQLAAWCAAGGAAYYLWIVPEQKKRERAKTSNIIHTTVSANKK